MKNIVSLVVLLVSALLVSGCGDDSANTASEPTTPAAQVTATASATDDLPWSSLNTTQKSVLSVGEKVWPNIPLEKRREMAAVADQWAKTSAQDQYKMINELRDYVGIAHIEPATKK